MANGDGLGFDVKEWVRLAVHVGSVVVVAVVFLLRLENQTDLLRQSVDNLTSAVDALRIEVAANRAFISDHRERIKVLETLQELDQRHHREEARRQGRPVAPQFAPREDD